MSCSVYLCIGQSRLRTAASRFLLGLLKWSCGVSEMTGLIHIRLQSLGKSTHDLRYSAIAFVIFDHDLLRVSCLFYHMCTCGNRIKLHTFCYGYNSNEFCHICLEMQTILTGLFTVSFLEYCLKSQLIYMTYQAVGPTSSINLNMEFYIGPLKLVGLFRKS